MPHALSAAYLIYGEQFNPELTLKSLSFFGDGNLELVPQKTQLRLSKAIESVDLNKLPTILFDEQREGQ